MNNNYIKYLKYKDKYLTLLFTINYIQDGGRLKKHKNKRSAPKIFGSNLSCIMRLEIVLNFFIIAIAVVELIPGI